jgi:hypothetical protein
MRPDEVGSVTAEFALTLPSVALVLVITLASFGLQIERMKIVAVAATVARALGRGEDEIRVTQLLSEAAPGVRMVVDHTADFVCASLFKDFKVANLGDFKVSERQCSRKMGL